MTGNIGIHGGNAAGRSWTALGMYPFMKKGAFMPGLENPVEKGHPTSRFSPGPQTVPAGDRHDVRREGF